MSAADKVNNTAETAKGKVKEGVGFDDPFVPPGPAPFAVIPRSRRRDRGDHAR